MKRGDEKLWKRFKITQFAPSINNIVTQLVCKGLRVNQVASNVVSSRVRLGQDKSIVDGATECLAPQCPCAPVPSGPSAK